MKISTANNVILRILMLVLIVVAVLLILAATGFFPLNNLKYTVDFIIGNPVNCIIVGVCTAIVLIFAVKILFAGERRVVIESVLLRTTANGNINISLTTVDEITQRFVRQNDNIRDMKSAVSVANNGVKIVLKLALRPDVNIPEVTTGLQDGLKTNVEMISGLQVSSINILVDTVTKTYLAN